jgi:hypothetical protein
MDEPLEVEMAERARAMVLAAVAPLVWESAADAILRAEGEFLRGVVAALQPMLHDVMRSRRIGLASDGHGEIMLQSDGTFVRVEGAGQQDAVSPLQVVRAEPSLLTLLQHIDTELLAADDPRSGRARDIIRLARHALVAAGLSAPVGSPLRSQM